MLYFFFFNDTATTEIYTFPYTTLFRSRKEPGAARADSTGNLGTLHSDGLGVPRNPGAHGKRTDDHVERDRKSTRLNSSHSQISYAVFCLKKKKKQRSHTDHIPTVMTYT